MARTHDRQRNDSGIHLLQRPRRGRGQIIPAFGRFRHARRPAFSLHPADKVQRTTARDDAREGFQFIKAANLASLHLFRCLPDRTDRYIFDLCGSEGR